MKPNYRWSVWLLWAALILAAPGVVLANAPFPQSEPTPAAAAPAAGMAGEIPWLALVVLGAPLIFMIWRSARNRKIKMTSAGCLPVIDEDKRPFRALDDDQS